MQAERFRRLCSVAHDVVRYDEGASPIRHWDCLLNTGVFCPHNGTEDKHWMTGVEIARHPISKYPECWLFLHALMAVCISLSPLLDYTTSQPSPIALGSLSGSYNQEPNGRVVATDCQASTFSWRLSVILMEQNGSDLRNLRRKKRLMATAMYCGRRFTQTSICTYCIIPTLQVIRLRQGRFKRLIGSIVSKSYTAVNRRDGKENI